MDFKNFFGHRIFKLVSVATFAASMYLVQPYRPVVFVGQSMSNTYQDREWAIATTNLSDLTVGDVVVIKYGESAIIKRVAYMPGDKIPYTKIGGSWIPDHSLQKEGLRHPERFPRKTVAVPADEIYVMGDNPRLSIDSRQLGSFPLENVVSKLVQARVAVPPKPEY